MVVRKQLHPHLTVTGPHIVRQGACRVEGQNLPCRPSRCIHGIRADRDIGARAPIEELPRPRLDAGERPLVIHLQLGRGHRAGRNAGRQSEDLIASVVGGSGRLELDVLRPGIGGTGFVEKINGTGNWLAAAGSTRRHERRRDQRSCGLGASRAEQAEE